METKLTLTEAMDHVEWWLRYTTLEAEGLDDTVSNWVYSDLVEVLKQHTNTVDEKDLDHDEPFVTEGDVEELLEFYGSEVWNEHLNQKSLDDTYNSMLRQLSAGTF
jgi:hypothetical protein